MRSRTTPKRNGDILQQESIVGTMKHCKQIVLPFVAFLPNASIAFLQIFCRLVFFLSWESGLGECTANRRLAHVVDHKRPVGVQSQD
jgi:hypothetical protein